MIAIIPIKMMSVVDFVHTALVFELPLIIDNYSQENIDLMYFFYHNTSVKTGISPDSPLDDFLKQQPAVALIFDSYLFNFCLYKDNPIYKKQCEIFHHLINGDYNYVVVPLYKDNNLYSRLFPDPSLSPTIYLVYKKGKEVRISP